MKIYVSHAKRTDFQNELYIPLREAGLPVEFIFPHDSGNQPFNIKELLQNKECDLVLAEVSFPATGQGIELAWANSFGVPIICVFKSGSDISGSLKLLTDKFISYENPKDMVTKLTSELHLNIA